MARKRKPSDTVQLKLRFPEALRRRLETEAKRHGASLNSEIVRTLEDRFRETDERKDQAHAIAGMVAELVSSELEDTIASALWDVERGKAKRAEEARAAEKADAERHLTEDQLRARRAEEEARKAEQEARSQAALDKALQAIERKFGRGAILRRAVGKTEEPLAPSETKDGEKK